MVDWTRRETLRAAGLAGAGLAGIGTASAQDDVPPEVTTWGAAMVPPGGEGVSADGFSDQTIRQVVHTSVGGDQARVRLANTFAEDAITVDAVTIGVRADGADVEATTLTEVTFDGSPGTTIGPGERILSDPADIQLGPDQDVVVSVYAETATGPIPWHGGGRDQVYIANGDLTGESSGGSFGEIGYRYFVVDGLTVRSSGATGTIVCFGDSITNGARSSEGANHTYPNYLARRINDSDVLQKSVVNAGIDGNRLLHDSIEGYNFGPRGLDRFDRDVLQQPGVTDVIILEGINDIIHSEAEFLAPGQAVLAEQIIGALEELATRCHDAGVRAIGGTITPFGGYSLYGDRPEEKRTTVNQWIRTTDVFDAVIDFAALLASPQGDHIMAGQYASSDQLHPNDRGYERMANGFDLTKLTEGYPQTTTTTTTTTTSTTTTTTTSTTTPTTTTSTAPPTTTAGDGGDGGTIPGFGLGTALAGLGVGAGARWLRGRRDS